MQEPSGERVRPSKDAAGYRRPRRGWQRATKRSRQTLQPRDTVRTDSEQTEARSPAEEVLAKHDAELRERQRDDDEGGSTIITF